MSDILKAIRRSVSPDWDELLIILQDAVLETAGLGNGSCPRSIPRDEVLAYACLSAIAYIAAREDKDAVEKVIVNNTLPLLGFRQQLSVSPDDHRRGFCVHSKDTVLFAFRGTINSVDWIINMSTDLAHGRGVHPGFDGAAESVWPWVRETLAARLSLYPRSFTRVVFTGHSLGGAIASLLAHRVSQLSDRNVNALRIEAHVFGCPLIGSSNLSFSFPLVRYNILGDEVPEITVFPTNASPSLLYARHGQSYILCDGYKIVQGATPERIALINWAYMLVEITRRFCYLRENSQDGYGQAVAFLNVPFESYCREYAKNAAVLGDNVPPALAIPLLLAMTAAMIGEQGRLPKEELNLLERFDSLLGKSEILKTIGILNVRLNTFSHITDAMDEHERMLETSKEYLVQNTILRAFSALALRKKHDLDNYITHLSLGRY